MVPILPVDKDAGEHYCGGRRGVIHDRHPLAGVPDHWNIMPNGDRTCSFCGSMHLADFEKFCRSVIDGTAPEGSRVEGTTKSYKVYVCRPDVRNAHDGAIKFYADHQPVLDADAHVSLVHEAIRKSVR